MKTCLVFETEYLSHSVYPEGVKKRRVIFDLIESQKVMTRQIYLQYHAQSGYQTIWLMVKSTQVFIPFFSVVF